MGSLEVAWAASPCQRRQRSIADVAMVRKYTKRNDENLVNVIVIAKKRMLDYTQIRLPVPLSIERGWECMRFNHRESWASCTSKAAPLPWNIMLLKLPSRECQRKLVNRYFVEQNHDARRWLKRTVALLEPAQTALFPTVNPFLHFEDPGKNRWGWDVERSATARLTFFLDLPSRVPAAMRRAAEPLVPLNNQPNPCRLRGS